MSRVRSVCGEPLDERQAVAARYAMLVTHFVHHPRHEVPAQPPDSPPLEWRRGVDGADRVRFERWREIVDRDDDLPRVMMEAHGDGPRGGRAGVAMLDHVGHDFL